MRFVGFPELSRGNSHHRSNPYTESHLFCRHQPSGPQGGMEPRLQHVLLGHRAGEAGGENTRLPGGAVPNGLLFFLWSNVYNKPLRGQLFIFHLLA